MSLAVPTIRIRVPIRTVSEANQREHWAVKARRVVAQRQAVAWAWLSARLAVAVPCIVTMTRIAPRELDDDNLRGALKAVRDEVALLLGLPAARPRKGQRWLIADDRDPRVEWHYGRHRGAPGEYAVVIEIVPAVVVAT
jgi:hypothetical protein